MRARRSSTPPMDVLDPPCLVQRGPCRDEDNKVTKRQAPCPVGQSSEPYSTRWPCVRVVNPESAAAQDVTPIPLTGMPTVDTTMVVTGDTAWFSARGASIGRLYQTDGSPNGTVLETGTCRSYRLRGATTSGGPVYVCDNPGDESQCVVEPAMTRCSRPTVETATRNYRVALLRHQSGTTWYYATGTNTNGQIGGDDVYGQAGIFRPGAPDTSLYTFEPQAPANPVLGVAGDHLVSFQDAAVRANDGSGSSMLLSTTSVSVLPAPNNSIVLFADDVAEELIATDGAVATTLLDINPVVASAFHDGLVFLATRPAAGMCELIATNGTTVGTSNLGAHPCASSVSVVAWTAGVAVFSFSGSTDVYFSDGSSAPTLLTSYSTLATPLGSLDGRALVAVGAPMSPMELHRIDGTMAGSQMVGSIPSVRRMFRAQDGHLGNPLVDGRLLAAGDGQLVAVCPQPIPMDGGVGDASVTVDAGTLDASVTADGGGARDAGILDGSTATDGAISSDGGSREAGQMTADASSTQPESDGAVARDSGGSGGVTDASSSTDGSTTGDRRDSGSGRGCSAGKANGTSMPALLLMVAAILTKRRKRK